MRLITDTLPAVIEQEQIPALPGHVFELCLDKRDSRIIQFFGSLAMWKWVGWAYEQVRIPVRRQFEARNVGNRLSPGLYRIPVEA